MRQLERERLRIAALRRLHPELAEALSFLATITEAASGLVPPDFDRSRLRQHSDLPPLCPRRFALDEDAATEAFRTFLEALAESPHTTIAKRILAALNNGRLVPRQLVRAYCVRDVEVFKRAAKRQTRLDPELLVNLAELAVKPQFIAAARVVEIETEKASRFPHRCPACGSPPDLALITDGSDADGIMIAVCRLCESEWPVRRTVCLYCGNEDSETLSYLQAEGQEESRIYVCDSCRHYLPVLDARERLDLAPAVERVALAHLEVVAQGRGAQPISALAESYTGGAPLRAE